MGRRRRNNRIKNKLDNPCVEEKSSSLSIRDGEKEKIVNCNDTKSLPVQKNISDLQLPKHDVEPSKMNSASVKPELELLTSTDNDGIMKEYDHKKNAELTQASFQNSHVSKFSLLDNTPNPRKSEELLNTSINKPIKDGNQNTLVSDKCGVRPKYEALNPVPELNMYHKKKDSLDITLTENSSGSDDEHTDSTSDFFRPVFHDRCESKRNTKQECNREVLKMKENFFSSIHMYKNSKTSFSNVYHRWLPERRNTLAKLQSLYEEVHDAELKYNETQAAFKELSYNSRCVKQAVENQTVDFFASLTAFFSDAVSGVASFAQACNVDSYQIKFQEIMDHDAEITKELYASRSRCVVRYQGIEEVMRNFHSDTFTSTVDKISNTLEVDKHWAAMKYAYQKDDMTKLADEIGKFFDNAYQSEVLGKVSDSVRRYVNNNPAALEACRSTGRAVYGAMNTFGEKKSNRNSIMGTVNNTANLCLMMEDKAEVNRLKSVIEDQSYRSKLETQIEDAIDSLESEMKEINDTHFQLFKSHIYNDDSD